MSAMPQQRRRKRRIPVTPPGSAAAVPTWGVRVYCTVCGEVQRNYGNWQALFNRLVEPHMRTVVPETADRRRWAEHTVEVRCPGGVVDLVKDRAP